jgi:hypothetical protein
MPIELKFSTPKIPSAMPKCILDPGRDFRSIPKVSEDMFVGAGVGKGISVGGGAGVGKGISVGGGTGVGKGASVGEGAGGNVAVGGDINVADGAAGLGGSGALGLSVSEGIHFCFVLVAVRVKVAV